MWYWVGLGVGIGVYVISLCSMEGTCYRKMGDGEKHWTFRFLVTEGITGPLRSTYLALREGEYKGAVRTFCSSWNPWFTIPVSMLGARFLMRPTVTTPLIEMSPLALPSQNQTQAPPLRSNLPSRIHRPVRFADLHRQLAPEQYA